MLGDNERDRSLQRNQIIGIVLMTGLLVAWSYFAMPPQPPRQPVAPDTAVTRETAETPGTVPAETNTAEHDRALPEEVSGLPPVAAAPADAADDEVVLQGDLLDLRFTRVGARLKQATVLLGDNGDDSVQLVPEGETGIDAEDAYPLGVWVSGALGDKANSRRWEVLPSRGDNEARFQFEWPGRARLTKTFRRNGHPHVFEVEVAYTNLGTETRRLGMDMKEPALKLGWAPNVTSGDENNRMAHQAVLWRVNGKNEYHYTSKFKEGDQGQVHDPEFVGIKSAYFLAALKLEPAQEGEKGSPDCLGYYQGSTKHFEVGIGVPRTEVAPGQTLTYRFQVYLGPTNLASLKAGWDGLDDALQFIISVRFMDQFAKFLLSVLNWFHAHVIANYGLAIIFLTVLVRVIMLPLTLKGMKSMKKMQKLAPEIEKLKEEVGDDKEELQRRTMEMWRERGVNPLGGCFPLLLQMPVFIALYRMLAMAFELRRAPFFFWITDLSEPDRMMELPFNIPIPLSPNPISSVNLLPILMGFAMVLSMKFQPSSATVQNPQQKIMMRIMPIFFSVICYNMASGLNLYILTSTLLGIAQNYIVHISDIDVDVAPKKKAGAKKYGNFYTAAQARKREAAKEMRRKKRPHPRATDGSVKKTGRGKKQ